MTSFEILLVGHCVGDFIVHRDDNGSWKSACFHVLSYTMTLLLVSLYICWRYEFYFTWYYAILLVTMGVLHGIIDGRKISNWIDQALHIVQIAILTEVLTWVWI